MHLMAHINFFPFLFLSFFFFFFRRFDLYYLFPSPYCTFDILQVPIARGEWSQHSNCRPGNPIATDRVDQVCGIPDPLSTV